MTVLAAYLVTGSDAVLRAEAVRALVGKLVGDADPSLVVEEHDPGDEADTAGLVDAAGTPPFLAARRVVVARDIGAYPSSALDPLLDYLAHPLPTTCLVLVAGEEGRIPARLVRAVRSVGSVVDAGAPRGRKRSSWLDSQLHHAPVRLDAAATELLDTHLGEDLGRLRTLLDALAAAYGSGARIGGDDLRPFLGGAGAVPPWELTDAIDAGDGETALGAVRRMLGAGYRHPLQVMAVLHRHYAQLLRLDGSGIDDEATAADALGLTGSTYPARKALAQARRLGHDGVARAVALLADADLDLRGRKGWPDELVLEVLVARLSRVSRSRGTGRRASSAAAGRARRR
ncbi:MAG: DNA polymerase III subunit delta [Acidimicrobiales bacterium]